jgi:hypothetical protein
MMDLPEELTQELLSISGRSAATAAIGFQD